jgi:hypothetical protein
LCCSRCRASLFFFSPQQVVVLRVFCVEFERKNSSI